MARRIVNPIFMYLTRRVGMSIDGTCVLSVPGRRTGRDREVVVNVLNLNGERFLVAPRGDTEWARNLHQAETGVLRIGAREELVHAYEVADAEKPPILRAYLRRWGRVVGRYFDVSGADASDAELRRIAPAHPVFRLAHR